MKLFFILVLACLSIQSAFAQSKSPTDCEEARRTVDNAFYETRNEPDAKIEFVLHDGRGEKKKIGDKRERYVMLFCDKRGFAEKCSVKRGDDNNDLGSMEVHVKDEVFGVIYFGKNKPSECVNPDNWDIY